MYLLIRKKQFYFILFLVALIVGTAWWLDTREMQQTMAGLPATEKVIFIDAGHGGRDPGRTGVYGVDEKDINLAIALRLQEYFETGGVKVFMSRVTDDGLYTENDSNKKRSDMRRRAELINSSDADIFLSIHQNSFTQTQYHGGQVFYHGKSEEGQYLAECIQEQFNTFIDEENDRQVKANNNYYVLRETNLPAVIVECGFISNVEEEKNLNDELYQQKVAFAIYKGVQNYFSVKTEE